MNCQPSGGKSSKAAIHKRGKHHYLSTAFTDKLCNSKLTEMKMKQIELDILF